MENYKISFDGNEIEVNISGEVKAENYNIKIQDIKDGTRTILDSIKKSIVHELQLSIKELTDPRETSALRNKIKKKLQEVIPTKIPHLTLEQKDYFTIVLLNEMLGLGNIEFILQDPNLEEVIIHKSNFPVMVYHKVYGWLRTNLIIKDEDEIRNYAAHLARKVGKQITSLNPLLDANMLSGDRANAVLYPIAYTGNTITIRKFRHKPWTVIDFIKTQAINTEVAALLWLGIQYEMNIIVSGGTAAGKTSLMNVILQFLPTNQRVISIEDTRELQLPKTLFYLPMVTRRMKEEDGDIGMQELLINSLRMRPDRIILGEIRKSEDAQVLFEAMHTGHSVYATVHADSSHETIKRLTNPPINISPNLLGTVDLNVVMFRDRRRNLRRVLQVAEYIEGEGDETIRSNIIYRWEPKNDLIKKHMAPTKIFEKLSQHTSLTIDQIKEDLLEKEKILNWIIKEDINDVDKIGKLVKEYYKNPKTVMEKIK